jgi:hypothetical protein
MSLVVSNLDLVLAPDRLAGHLLGDQRASSSGQGIEPFGFGRGQLDVDHGAVLQRRSYTKSF